ncbi:MAG: hypothetical protein Q9174_000179 [Haloplaca sp. 1 TL-2023]
METFRQALKSHPDRVPSDSPERPARTKKFQAINDAYYTLSDPSRRREYDSARAYHTSSSAFAEDSDPGEEEIPRAEPPKGSSPWSAFGFGAKTKEDEEKFSNEQFGGVFEEMLREEGLAEGQEARPTGKFWSLVGGLSGGAMGFIVANFPGALAGAVAGNRLGAVRDARGKSVYSVFQDLSSIPQPYVPYSGDEGGESTHRSRRSWWQLSSRSVKPQRAECDNCKVHLGFMTSWRHTRLELISQLEELTTSYPGYKLTLVGHSLGGAVAALAALEFSAKGWSPQITTFGEPKIGNQALMKYMDKAFHSRGQTDMAQQYRRVTHVDDPVPLLPLGEWGYSPHGGQIHIFKPDLPPEKSDLRHCKGDVDPQCIAGAQASSWRPKSRLRPEADFDSFEKWWTESKGLGQNPARFRKWQLLFAHRDYFWRLGLCIPGGYPWN